MWNTLVTARNNVEYAFSQFQKDDAAQTLEVVNSQAESLCDLWETKLGIDEPVLFDLIVKVTDLKRVHTCITKILLIKRIFCTCVVEIFQCCLCVRQRQG